MASSTRGHHLRLRRRRHASRRRPRRTAPSKSPSRSPWQRIAVTTPPSWQRARISGILAARGDDAPVAAEDALVDARLRRQDRVAHVELADAEARAHLRADVAADALADAAVVERRRSPSPPASACRRCSR